MTRFILVTGGKGGIAKTTTAVSLGCALSQFGKDVTVVDANLTTPNVGIYLGSPVVPVSLHHVLQGKSHISESVYMHPIGTKIVPGSISVDDLKNTNPENLKKVLKGLKGITDVVLIDSPAGLGKEALYAMDSADEVLIVTNAEMSAVADALKTIRVVQELNKKILGIVVTRHRDADDEMSIAEVESMLEHEVVGVIPESLAVKESHAKRENVVVTHPLSDVAVNYKSLAAKLAGVDYVPESKPEPQRSSRMTSFLRFFGLH